MVAGIGAKQPEPPPLENHFTAHKLTASSGPHEFDIQPVNPSSAGRVLVLRNVGTLSVVKQITVKGFRKSQREQSVSRVIGIATPSPQTQ